MLIAFIESYMGLLWGVLLVFSFRSIEEVRQREFPYSSLTCILIGASSISFAREVDAVLMPFSITVVLIVFLVMELIPIGIFFYERRKQKKNNFVE